jgi:hypothetical protein
MYDKATEVTVRGEVTEVTTVQGSRSKSGVHVTVAGDTGTVTVHLGPASYLETQNLTLAKGDVVEIVGSKVQVAGEEVVVARTVKKGETTTVLRDENGLPLWSRARSLP